MELVSELVSWLVSYSVDEIKFLYEGEGEGEGETI
jgi:hypothetical protein